METEVASVCTPASGRNQFSVSSIPPTWKQGYAFKNNKIYVFGKSRILIARGWPQPMAWSKTKTIPWQPTRKWAEEMLSLEMYQYSAAGNSHIKSIGFESYADLSTDAYWQQKHEAAFGVFAKTFPEEILNAAMQFLERRWQVLCFLSRCPEAIDLFKSNPAILFCVANNWVFHTPAVKNPMRAGRALIKRKQRDILEWLGFKGTDKVRRILAKIPVSDITVERLLYLRDTLNHEHDIKTLAHLPVLNKEVLRILCDPRISKTLSYSALKQVALDEHKNSFVPNIINLLSISRTASEIGLTNQRLINKVDNIETEYFKLTNQLRVIKQTYEFENFYFPVPPYKGSEDIQPILSKASLEAEGQTMQNCAATRLNEILSGSEYIYHVHSPINATLSIKRTAIGDWKLNELKGLGNKEVNPALAKSIFLKLKEN